MKTVKTIWNLGNFTVALDSEVTDDIFARLASLGLRFLGQRNTEVDKILGGFTVVGGKSKRIPGWTRNSVEYDAALASKLCLSFAKLELPLADGEKEAPVVEANADVVRYEREAAALQYRDAKEIAGTKESAGTLETWLVDKAKYDGPTHGDDGEFAPAMLAAIHKVWIAHQAAMKAGI